MNLEDLKKEIPYRWKVQTANEHGCVCVAYIEARDVFDVLDKVCSPDCWQTEFKEIRGRLFAGIGIYNGAWIWKWDIGTEPDYEKEKGEVSDSIKRAGVQWGIGRFLYSLKVKNIPSAQWRDKWKPANESGKIIWDKDELNAFVASYNGTQKPKERPQAPKTSKPISDDEKKKFVDTRRLKLQTSLTKPDVEKIMREIGSRIGKECDEFTELEEIAINRIADLKISDNFGKE